VCHCGKPIVSGILGHNWWPTVPGVTTLRIGVAIEDFEDFSKLGQGFVLVDEME
jgi:hypothetical protein